MAKRHEPAPRTARQRGTGARPRGAQRRYEGGLADGHRPVQRDQPGRGPAVRHVPGRCAHVRAVPVSRVLRALEAHGRRQGDHLCVQPRGSPTGLGDAAFVGRPVPGGPAPRPGRADGPGGGCPQARNGVIALHHAGAAHRGDAVPGRRARALCVKPAARTAGIHGLHGQRAVAAVAVLRPAGGTGGEDRRRREPGRSLDRGFRRGRAASSRRRFPSNRTAPTCTRDFRSSSSTGRSSRRSRRDRRESASGRCTCSRCRTRRSSRHSRARGGCSS